MFRGYIKFTCDDCGNKFWGPDIEYMATVWSWPQPCPKCGSKHTYPRSFLGLNKGLYKNIWKSIEKND